MLRAWFVLVPSLLFSHNQAFGADVMKPIQAGTLKLLYPAADGKKEVQVKSFLIDELPVTNEEFAAFVKKSPEWEPKNTPAIYADSTYLAQMVDAKTKELHRNFKSKQPVTNVSWFAADAYCRAQGKRLPSENEWEYVARAGKVTADASADPKWNQAILDWYAKPGSKGPNSVKQGEPNFWGVYDMHELIWEWVEDFNSSQVISDSRSGGKEDKMRFCGGGSLSADDKVAYASYMRFAFRSSLTGTSTIGHLGFRCAKEASK